MAITTTVTFSDILSYHQAELDDYRDAHDELTEYARDEYGDHRAEWGEDITSLLLLVTESAKTVEQRINFIERVQDEYDGSEFTIKMLSGRELSEIESELRMTAQKRDTDIQQLSSERKMETLDRAITSAPEGFPSDDDGNPEASNAPNALALSLHEQVQLLNQSGETGFRAAGFGDELDSALSGMFGSPKSAAKPSERSDLLESAAQPSGDSVSAKPESDSDATPDTT